MAASWNDVGSLLSEGTQRKPLYVQQMLQHTNTNTDMPVGVSTGEDIVPPITDGGTERGKGEVECRER